MNTIGTLFRVSSFGESHGPAIGVMIDGCPANLDFDMESILMALNRRRPGNNELVSQRNEEDLPEVISGVFENKTTGAPITLMIRNTDARPGDYENLRRIFRPSHADFTYFSKYGIRDHRGGGRASARVTAGWVAAGAIAQWILRPLNIQIIAYVKQVHEVKLNMTYHELNLEERENNAVRCPDPATAALMETAIREAMDSGDSLGGVISCVIRHVSPGLGEPLFDKLHARLAHAVMSINAVKGIQFGDGFGIVSKKGSEANDVFIRGADGKTHTASNHSGGIQGGISNGEDIYFETVFKPTATILQAQQTVAMEGNAVTVTPSGRHDPCVLPRAVPIVEAMSAIVLADMIMLQKAYTV